MLAVINLKSISCVRAQDYAERRALRGELKALAKEERSRQQKAITEARPARQLACKPHISCCTLMCRERKALCVLHAKKSTMMLSLSLLRFHSAIITPL